MSKLRDYAAQFMRIMYFEAQKGLCGICAKPMSKKGLRGGKKLNFDHVWPRCRSSHRTHAEQAHGNLVLAHCECNAAKADRRPTTREVDFLRATNRALGLPEGQTLQWDRPPSRPEIGANENEPEHQKRGDAAAQ